MAAMVPGGDAIAQLVEVSRHYGRDAEFVLAGGGNTSLKDEQCLWVKASGSSLARIDAEGFVALDRGQLQALLDSDLGDDPGTREDLFKNAILAARLQPGRGQRPSVECVIHHLLPGRLVVHTHATWVNMITCSRNGETIARELCGDEALWIPYVDPGYTLAQTIAAELRRWQARHGAGKCPVLLLDNHGLFVCGESPENIHEKTRWIVGLAKARVGAILPEAVTAQPRTELSPASLGLIPAIRGAMGDRGRLPIVSVCSAPEAIHFSGLDTARAITERGPLTPDQIVYCGSFPLWLPGNATVVQAADAIAAYRQRHGASPRIIILPHAGLLSVAVSPGDAETHAQVYLDAIRVMLGAEKLGGVDYLDAAQRGFIEAWEVEAYRKKVSAAASRGGRLQGKVVLVTGAAQGFGLEIAEGVAGEGAVVVLADVNKAKARAEADRLNEKLGLAVASAEQLDVTNDLSVAAARDRVVQRHGGLDVLVSNAGILRAGSVMEQSPEEFAAVTAVNYTGYFLLVRAFSPVMAAQHVTAPDWLGDIIQINSKSGLVGSNRNGAYAGSKFGGIGLTQSFALELVEFGIKVNSICPGNFYDGPLWSDPENGLFVQYLRTGKVPGAKTIAEVRRFYESKTPMKRGCTAVDVLRAILYLIDQQYETGQALPVTGGQVMLH